MHSKPWPSRDIAQRVRDILDALDALGSFIEGIDEAGFARDRKTRSAVERELLTISEAYVAIHDLEESSGIAAEDRLEVRFPAVPWHKVRGIGNRLRHEYGRVDPGTIWNTVADSDDLRSLRHALIHAFPT
jgi:uncharacterized protein with HEPN domain